MQNDVIFELGCEELPSLAVKQLSAALVEQLSERLSKAQLTFASIEAIAAPRRLGCMIRQLDCEQAAQTIQRRGPAIAAAYDAQGQPTPALLGFAKSCGVGLEALSRLETDKGVWMVYEAVQPGQSVDKLLPQMISETLASLPIAKPMRWGNQDYEFVRPVHWVLLLLGNTLIPARFLGMDAGSHSRGHRFHSPEPVAIQSAASYADQLRQAHVIANFEQRRAMIVEQIQALTQPLQAEAIMPADLLDEVTSIVEWPQALMAEFDPAFLEVPAEALIASMQAHQKCFALQDQSGKLLPRFITIANLDSRNPAQVIAGNEKVMRARLSDAAFFFRQDKKQALASHMAGAEKVLFEARLGSLQDKARRMAILVQALCSPLQLEADQANRAAALSKCDLLTGMVGEFPELQGLMGYYYALHDGEDKAVAVALNEQYMPRFAKDALPDSRLGKALSLADRLDTLAGIFAIGQRPTGVKDPFKLRRHALAVVRLLASMPEPVNLTTLLHLAMQGLPPIPQPAKAEPASDVVAEIKAFILERLQSHYIGQGFAAETIAAVRQCQSDWLYDFEQRLLALHQFVNQPAMAALAAACKRVNNILAQAPVAAATLDPQRLQQSEEVALVEAMEAAEDKLAEGQLDYVQQLTILADLRPVVDAFFNGVMVMADDPALRANRLQILRRLQALLGSVADISQLSQCYDD